MKKSLYLGALITITLGSCKSDKTEYDASGVFEATEVIVSAKATGEITELNVEEGQEVTQGTILGSIDSQQLNTKRDQLQATKAATEAGRLNAGIQTSSLEAQLATLEQQVRTQEQQVQVQQNQVEAQQEQVTTSQKQIEVENQRLTNLKKERVRFQALANEKAGTQKQVDDIDYQINVIEKQIAVEQAQVEAAKKQVNTAKSQIDMTREQMEGTRKQMAVIRGQIGAQTEQINAKNSTIGGQEEGIDAQLSQVDLQLGDASISSPLTGTIMQKYAQQGEFASPGKPLFKVANLKKLYLRAYITADQLTGIKLGQNVTIYADKGTEERKAYKGTVSWISEKAEFTPKTIQTRDERANLVYAVKIRVDNDGLIKCGMYGDVKF